ncbi:MAG TPA: thioredoxin TrxC [Gammaproteobacteria bacterium]|nr:thioredoxin TrxC [Gammaproteobacteria bacterium]
MPDRSDSVHVVCPHCTTANRVPVARLGEQPSCGKCKRKLFEGQPLVLNRANFERHLTASDLPLVVDFWAPWCGPCRQMAPAFEAAAATLEPHYRLAKLNTDDEGELAGRYGIRSIPTLIVFKGGREVARQAGALQAGSLVEWIRRSS